LHVTIPPRGETVSQFKKGSRQSRESGNPVAILFEVSTDWMPFFTGMTNYDTFSGGGVGAITGLASLARDKLTLLSRFSIIRHKKDLFYSQI
jgi:hypothetical protein